MANILIDYDSINYRDYIDREKIRNIVERNIQSMRSRRQSTMTDELTQLFGEVVTAIMSEIIEPISSQLSTRTYEEFEKVLHEIQEDVFKNLENE